MAVYWYKAYGKWSASITYRGQKYFLGYHLDRDAADLAYETKRAELYAAEPTLEERLLAGRVVNPVTDCWIWQRGCEKAGYGLMTTGGLGTQRQYKVHRVAAHVWKGLPLDGPHNVLHTCDTPPCFNPEHLFEGTIGDNNRDRAAKRRGREARQDGVANPNVRLTEADVLEIERLVQSGLSQQAVADRFGVIQPHVSRIVRHEAWQHLWEG